MKFNNTYFINGTAYAGKSTMVKLLAEKSIKNPLRRFGGGFYTLKEG